MSLKSLKVSQFCAISFPPNHCCYHYHCERNAVVVATSHVKVRAQNIVSGCN